jgi:hypothetical protein
MAAGASELTTGLNRSCQTLKIFRAGSSRNGGGIDMEK